MRKPEGAGEGFNAAGAVRLMGRITVLFKRLAELEEKLGRAGRDGSAGLAPTVLVTQLRALRLCAAITEEIREAEALLGRGAE